jgi:DNA-binding winged helix-turn-helix (wHTH) protein
VAAYLFGEFRLNADTRQLLRGSTAVHLTPKAFQLLQALVEAAPRALSKSELQDALWPDTFVVEANLQHLITEIRGALGETPREPRYVRTVHGFGYAFQEPLAASTRHSGSPLACLLRWDGGRVTLSEGEHVIGRDPAADVVLDFGSVSRRHARIRIGPSGVTLEDTGSKNGTFVRDRRVEQASSLVDGDEIRIGMVAITVRIMTEAASTETAILAEPGP